MAITETSFPPDCGWSCHFSLDSCSQFSTLCLVSLQFSFPVLWGLWRDSFETNCYDRTRSNLGIYLNSLARHSNLSPTHTKKGEFKHDLIFEFLLLRVTLTLARTCGNLNTKCIILALLGPLNVRPKCHQVWQYDLRQTAQCPRFN